MKIRWGSTYVMLNHAESKQNVSTAFLQNVSLLLTSRRPVDELAHEPGVWTDGIEAHKKINALMLSESESEWQHVSIFCSLLSVSFLLYFNIIIELPTCSMPTEHNRHSHLFTFLPYLTLFLQLKRCMPHAEKLKYHPFKSTLNAATTKLDEYYQKTADSDAHVLAMCKFPILLYGFHSDKLISVTPWAKEGPLRKTLEYKTPTRSLEIDTECSMSSQWRLNH